MVYPEKPPNCKNYRLVVIIWTILNQRYAGFSTKELVMHKIILVPIDLNQSSLTDKVISEVNGYSINKSAHFYFLTVISPIEKYNEYGVGYPVITENTKSEDELTESIKVELKAVISKFEIPENQITLLVKIGSIADTIIDVSQQIKADLIIIGSRNPSFKTHILGSTASSLVHYAKTSVFIVR